MPSKWQWTRVPEAGVRRCSTWPWWPNSTGAIWARAPLLEAQVAGRLLGRLASDAKNAPAPKRHAARLLESALADAQLVTLALHPPTQDGMLRLVPAGAIADDVIYFDGSSLRHIELDSAGERRAVTTIGSLPLADIQLPASAAARASAAASAPPPTQPQPPWPPPPSWRRAPRPPRPSPTP